MYTDASLKGARGVLEAALFKTQESNRLVYEFVLPNTAPRCLLGRFCKSSQIYGIELNAVTAAISQLEDVDVGKTATIYRDNEASAHALVKGDSDPPPTHTPTTILRNDSPILYVLRSTLHINMDRSRVIWRQFS